MYTVYNVYIYTYMYNVCMYNVNIFEYLVGHYMGKEQTHIGEK